MSADMPQGGGDGPAAPRLGPREFRHAAGQFATGVTVVAANVDGRLHALTVNSFTSVSLDPMLILFCLGRQARTAGPLQRADAFSINILRQEQQALATYFAGGWRELEPPPFRFVEWPGGPRLEGCAAAIGCAAHDVIDGGDHVILMGRVVALHHGTEPRPPLIFHAGRYRTLAPAAAPTPGSPSEESPQVFYDPWSATGL